jgi:hypothetical protein
MTIKICNRVCENFRGPMEMLERDHSFQCLAEYSYLCVGLKKGFFSGQLYCWIWWCEFDFLVFLSELTIQCVIAIYQ